MNVKCSKNAKFFTDSLDNDFIRIEVPSDGNGLPPELIDVDWDGGFFDQRNQRNSTVVPFMPEYPPAKPGKSSTCDAVSIRGYYTSKDGVKAGIRRAHARRVVTMAGEHWQSAGGDSGVFIGGALDQKIELCYFKGSRDLGAYPSAHESGQLNCSVSVEDNIFDSCFHGVSAKRGFKSIQITKNTFINCVRAAQSEFLSVRNKNASIYNNTFIGCGINARCQQTDGGGIWGNRDENHGATLENGAIEPLVGLCGYRLDSCTDIDVGPNSASGENPAAAIVYPTQGQGLLVTGESSGCVLRSNKFRGWRRVGADQSVKGKNRWIDNTCPDGTAKYVAFDDINNSSEERVAEILGNAKWFRTPVYCFLTDEKNPIIRGYNGVLPSDAGIYFKGPDIGLAGPNVLVEGNLYPVSPNKTLLGAPTSPLAGGTTQSALTVISDEREKTTPLDITDKMLDAWSEVQLVQFQYLDRVEAKGKDGARWHFGVIAQRAVEAFARHGLDAYQFGFLCYDEWKEKPAEFRKPTPEEVEAGICEESASILVSEGVEAGSRYGIRYEEALALEAALQRRNYQQLLKRIEALEAN
ncbi:tail fiber domain-containing protein [Aeromonas veronii]|uniref:tail fiber domain-containing protein n=1 Tax=Aeromonas veronii TaxID=654 RepID=UPI003D1C8223